MSVKKEAEQNDSSLVQDVIDIFLWPLRVATSPALLRTYLRTILLIFTSTILFVAALIAYTSFYYTYIPIRGISIPIYLQYDHATHPPSTFAAPHNAKWPYGIGSIHGLVDRQKYDVEVEMDVPRSKGNLEAGNWMVGLELRGPQAVGLGIKGLLGWDEDWMEENHSQGGDGPLHDPESSTPSSSLGSMSSRPETLARSRRPAILTYRSYVVEAAHRLLRLPLYLIGWHSETEHVRISMMEGVVFSAGAKNVPASLRLELRARYPLEVYRVTVKIAARLEGLRWVMYKYRLTSACVGVSLFWMTEMGVLLCTWGFFTLLFRGHHTPDQTEVEGSKRKTQKIKTEDTDSAAPRREPKADSHPGTPHSETSRTFPTLPSQQPLRYIKTEPRGSEEPFPPLDPDTAPEGEDEADDEDDDFVVEEAVDVSARERDRDRDSGIGTGVESAVDREVGRGVARRRSGRLRGEDA